MAKHSLEPFCKQPRAVIAVVDRAYHGIFKGYAPVGCGSIIAACFEQRFNVPAAVYRHRPVSYFIARSVERNGKGQLQLFFHKLIDTADNAAG